MLVHLFQTGLYSGVSRFSHNLYTGETYCNYDDLVVTTFRSRGVSTQSSGGPVYQVTGGTDVQMVCTGSTFGDVNTDPFILSVWMSQIRWRLLSDLKLLCHQHLKIC